MKFGLAMNHTNATALFEMNENRKLERFDLELSSMVEVLGLDAASATGVMNLRTKDVCAGGAFFAADTRLPEGARVKILMVMPIQKLKKWTEKNVHIRVQGQVVRSTPNGFAIQFEPDYRIESC